jgi:CubicO group peptidase (beta-lactamase class C family)
MPDRVTPRTRVSIQNGRWFLHGVIAYRGTKAEGLLMNVRMVNAVFEDRHRPDFDPDANTDEFIAQIPGYVAQGVRAFTVCLQGGSCGYEGALNSAFDPDGSLRDSYLHRVRRVIEACDRSGAAVILGCYYQRQDQVLKDQAAVRAGVVNVVKWIEDSGFANVVLEIANEFGHNGFDHRVLKTPEGIVELIGLAKRTSPSLLVSASGLGNGQLPDNVARASDFLLIHFNSTAVKDIPGCIAALKKFGKPIVCNEDPKAGAEGAAAAEACVANGASWGLMLVEINQHYPFTFQGPADDPEVYAAIKRMTSTGRAPSAGGGPDGEPSLVRSGPSANGYFPPPESQGGWRKLDKPQDIRKMAGMDPAKLEELKQWLLQSDKRDFAAVVIRRGYIVLEVERGNSAKTDSRRVASVSNAVCATVLAIAAEQSRQGLTPKKMTFDDPAFQFIPWAQPLSDPRKAQITVKQLLNHTSGLCPEATGAPNDGTWEYVLGHSDEGSPTHNSALGGPDLRTAKLAFDPGTACGYSTIALHHAALVCETVTGKPYDQFAIEALFKPLGIEHWWFQYFDGGEGIGRHPTHGLGMPARDLARIAYCMLSGGRWGDRQVIPKWFVDETAAPTHNVQSPEMRWKFNPQIFSHGWELPARLTGEGGRSGEGIPADARDKPGSGGQLIAFVPSLDLVVTRQTGSSGEWAFEDYLRRACAAVTRD